MLHPSRLDQGGLVETLRWYVNAVSGQHLNVSAELPSTAVTISKEAEIVLFRLAQECLNYLVGRPGSREAVLRLTTKRDIVLQIIINGSMPLGLRDALLAGHPETWLGLTGVRERLRQLGGKLDVMSGENRAVVEASLPRGQ
jgi:signal transduction histidine kinase